MIDYAAQQAAHAARTFDAGTVTPTETPYLVTMGCREAWTVIAGAMASPAPGQAYVRGYTLPLPTDLGETAFLLTTALRHGLTLPRYDTDGALEITLYGSPSAWSALHLDPDMVDGPWQACPDWNPYARDDDPWPGAYADTDPAPVSSPYHVMQGYEP